LIINSVNSLIIITVINVQLKLLLDNGAEVNRTADQGRTALLYAVSKGRTGLVAELIS